MKKIKGKIITADTTTGYNGMYSMIIDIDGNSVVLESSQYLGGNQGQPIEIRIGYK